MAIGIPSRDCHNYCRQIQEHSWLVLENSLSAIAAIAIGTLALYITGFIFCDSVIEILSLGTHEVNPSWYHQAFCTNCFPLIKMIFCAAAIIAAAAFVICGTAKLLADYVFTIEDERDQIV